MILNWIQSKNCNFNCFLNESLVPESLEFESLKQRSPVVHTQSQIRLIFFCFFVLFFVAIHSHTILALQSIKKIQFQLSFKWVTLRVTRVTQNQNINISHSILNSIEFFKICHFFDCNLLLHYYWIKIYQKIAILIVF